MKLFKFLAALAAILLIQTLVLARFQTTRLIDLFLLVNIYYALNHSQLSTIAFAITSGLLQDSFSEGIIGLNAFSKTVVAYLLSSLSARLMIKHPFIIMLLIGISTCMDLFIIAGLHALFGLPATPLTERTIAIAALFNMFVGTIGFQITDKVTAQKEYA